MNYFKKNLHLLPIFYLLFLVATNLLMYIVRLVVKILREDNQITIMEYWYRHDWNSSDLTWSIEIAGSVLGIIFFLLIWQQKKFSIKKRAALAGVYFLCAIGSLFLLPAMNIKHEPARKLSCMLNLKAIHNILQNHTLEHDNQCPPNLQTLVQAGYITIFRCPSGGQCLPEFSDYVYLSAARTNDEKTSIIISDSICNHAGNYRKQIYSDDHSANISPTQQ